MGNTFTDCTACCESSTSNAERSRQHRRRIALAHKKLQHPYADLAIESQAEVQHNNLVEAIQNTQVTEEGEFDDEDYEAVTYKV